MRLVRTDSPGRKLQALVYESLPSTVFSYAIGSRKLSANEQFFDGAQTVVSLLQTTQTKQGVSFRLNRDGTVFSFLLFFFFFTRGGCVSCLRACFGAKLLL